MPCSSALDGQRGRGVLAVVASCNFQSVRTSTTNTTRNSLQKYDTSEVTAGIRTSYIERATHLIAKVAHKEAAWPYLKLSAGKAGVANHDG